MTRAGALEFLEDRDAEKAHLGKPLPQRLVIGALPSSTSRTAFGGHGENFLASSRIVLVVGEIEVHGGLLALVTVS